MAVQSTMTHRRGFTLVELLATIAIVGLLVGLLLPAVQSARESSRRTTCQNNLREWGSGIAQYESANGAFPPAAEIRLPENCYPGNPGACRGTPLCYLIMPFIGQQNIYARYDVGGFARQWWGVDNTGWNTPSNTAIQGTISTYRCPSQGPSGQSQWTDFATRLDYYGVTGGGDTSQRAAAGDYFKNGMFSQNRWLKGGSVLDGLSNTLAVGESIHPSQGCYDSSGLSPAPCTWVWGHSTCSSSSCTGSFASIRGFRSAKQPINAWLLPFSASSPAAEIPFGSAHAGVAGFVFADGHTAFISDTINMQTYWALSTRAGRKDAVLSDAY